MKRTTIWLKIDQILKTRPGTNLVAGDYSRRCARGWSNTFPIRPCDEYSDRRKWTTEAGSQYVLFLWRSIPTSPEYEIIFHSGYQLKNGRVYPLDDVNSQYVAVDATFFWISTEGNSFAEGKKNVKTRTVLFLLAVAFVSCVTPLIRLFSTGHDNTT